MLEDFLHFVWRTRRFDIRNLQSSQGHKIQIHRFGHYNTNAGPDFLEAKIEIDGTLWAGNVEMHLKSSDWYAHKHQFDPQYNNVILHVVYTHDKEVYLHTGEVIPCLVLEDLIQENLKHNYKRLLSKLTFIPCEDEIKAVPLMHRISVFDKLLIERLESRTAYLLNRLAASKNDWEEICYQHLASVFGLKVNKEAFDCLARALPYKLLKKHQHDLHQMESLLFGQAGMLDEAFAEAYPNQLKKEYEFLRKKYDLTSIPKTSWKYMRMRPVNFPSIRIAQFAQFLYQTDHVFSKIVAAESTKELMNLFKVKVSGYWKNHFVFGKQSKPSNKNLGASFKYSIIINGVAPLLLLYSKSKDEDKFMKKALNFLEDLKPEQNKIIRQFESLGLNAAHSGDSQSLLQLYNNYCSKKKCASCGIGNVILK